MTVWLGEQTSPATTSSSADDTSLDALNASIAELEREDH
jgi:hypothetical protein